MGKCQNNIKSQTSAKRSALSQQSKPFWLHLLLSYLTACHRPVLIANLWLLVLTLMTAGKSCDIRFVIRILLYGSKVSDSRRLNLCDPFWNINII